MKKEKQLTEKDNGSRADTRPDVIGVSTIIGRTAVIRKV